MTTEATAMIGLPLSTYPDVLTKVAPEHDARPVRSFDAVERMGPHARAHMEYNHETTDLEKVAHHLPSASFARLTTDETAKIVHSLAVTQNDEAERVLMRDPVVRLTAKIRSSMWRWGHSQRSWNDVVDAYDGIRSFDLAVPGFEVMLDHTTWNNERGCSEHGRVYLDGALALMVHWKGRHVMTIGFSVASHRRILLQQVQLRSRTGNRWLFRFPANRVEHVVDRLKAAFPGHVVMIADGGDVADVSLRMYRENHRSASERGRRLRARLAASPHDEDIARDAARTRQEARELAARIAHLRADRPRLKALYADVGRHDVGEAFRSNDVNHHAIAA